MRKGLFITLDNVLIKTLSGREYSLHTQDWKFNNQVVEAVKDYNYKGYKIIVITNQSQIYKGLTTEKLFNIKFENVLGALEKHLKLKNNSIASNYCIEEDTYNYIPNPGMVYEIAIEFELDLFNSFLIGNSIYEKELAKKAGISNYLDVTDLNYPL